MTKLDPVTLPTPGLYRHFKGMVYQVIGTARHSETDEILVLYNPADAPEPLYARPLAMFFETINRDGLTGPRFVKLTS